MRPAPNRKRPRGAAALPDDVDINDVQGGDPLLTEHATMVQDDEEEVFDLGFIVDDRDDRRDTLLASWQRLDELDSDEALETDPTAPLPAEAAALEEEGVPGTAYPSNARVATADAEADEDEFARDNFLVDDPYAPPQMNRTGLEDPADEDLDGDDEPEMVGIRGRARGVVRGLGTSVPQDIGGGGFSVRDNPLAAPAAQPDAEGPLPGDLPRPRNTPRPGERSKERGRSRPNGRRAP